MKKRGRPKKKEGSPLWDALYLYPIIFLVIGNFFSCDDIYHYNLDIYLSNLPFSMDSYVKASRNLELYENYEEKSEEVIQINQRLRLRGSYDDGDIIWYAVEYYENNKPIRGFVTRKSGMGDISEILHQIDSREHDKYILNSYIKEIADNKLMKHKKIKCSKPSCINQEITKIEKDGLVRIKDKYILDKLSDNTKEDYIFTNNLKKLDLIYEKYYSEDANTDIFFLQKIFPKS